MSMYPSDLTDLYTTAIRHGFTAERVGSTAQGGHVVAFRKGVRVLRVVITRDEELESARTPDRLLLGADMRSRALAFLSGHLI